MERGAVVGKLYVLLLTRMVRFAEREIDDEDLKIKDLDCGNGNTRARNLD